MSLEQIIGQDTAVNLLKSALNKEQKGLSFLFYGPKGTGKSFTALQFAKSLNCEKNTSGCCDSCSSCLRAEKLSYPDLHWLDYQAESQTMKIEQTRSIQEAAYLRPFEARVKVFVVNNCENLSPEAGNSLLKIVEEPPLDTVIILITSSTRLVLPTILSRCRKIRFGRLSRIELSRILRQNGADEKTGSYLAYSTCGRLGQALSELKSEPLKQRDALLAKLANLARPEDFLKDKEEANKVLLIIMQWYRDILLLKSGVSEDCIINRDRLEDLRQACGAYSYPGLISFMDNLGRTFGYLKRNLNTRLLSDNIQVDLEYGKTNPGQA